MHCSYVYQQVHCAGKLLLYEILYRENDTN